MCVFLGFKNKDLTQCNLCVVRNFEPVIASIGELASLSGQHRRAQLLTHQHLVCRKVQVVIHMETSAGESSKARVTISCQQ